MSNKKIRRESGFSKTWFVVAVMVLGIVAVGYGVYWSTFQPQPDTGFNSASRLEVLPSEYDFGAVSVQTGEVSTTFTLRNKSNTEIVLHDMDTSCGCTEAAIVVDGREGPRFNMRMHGKNPKDWSARIEPGEQVELRVYYNPRTHLELRGAVTRKIYLFGEDLRNPLKTLRIYVNQTS